MRFCRGHFRSCQLAMEADWPANPECSVICILCKKETPLRDSNPDEYFRHLIRDHSTYFNLNLLLELSLSQPRALSDYSNNLKSNQQQQQHFPTVPGSRVLHCTAQETSASHVGRR